MNAKIQPVQTFQLFPNSESESCITADSTFWIPYISTSNKIEFDLTKIQARHLDLSQIELNCTPSVFGLKLSFLKILFDLEPFDSLTLLTNLWRHETEAVRKRNFTKTVELIYFVRTVLQDCSEPEKITLSVFNQTHYQLIAKTDLLKEMLLREIVSLKSNVNNLPKWKGKSMQFIELISIGIELGLFDGASQNEICNSLLKAFQVDAESDQPIYKQRFNALFKRSKIQLPLIADYINRVETTKGMKIVFYRQS